MSRALQAVVFGAGKVACGLLGRILCESGYHNVFVARRREVIEAVNRKSGYSVDLLNGGIHRVNVGNCRALSIADQQAVTQAVRTADLVFTAVGIDNLQVIAPSIAEGVWLRSRDGDMRALNVIACENLPGAGAYLRHQILSVTPVDRDMVVDNVSGFSAAVTRQIMTGGNIENGIMSFSVEGDSELIIDANGLRSPLPELCGAKLTNEFAAMVTRKLFTLNCAHAAAAYLGYLEGCRYMHEAAAHPRVAPVFLGAVAEAQAALKAEFPNQALAIEQEVTEALRQIADPRLADPVTRVARGPRRKLSPRERLVGPAKAASRHRLPNGNLCKAIAAALAYDFHKDPEAVALQQAIADDGLEKIITEDCGLLPHEPLAQAVKYEWHRLKAGNPQNGAAALEKIMLNVASELSQKYNPQVVSEVVSRVGERFKEARVWSYVPILMEKSASQELRKAARAARQ